MQTISKEIKLIKVMYKYWDDENEQEPFLLLLTSLSSKRIESLFETYERKVWETEESFVKFLKEREPNEFIEDYENLNFEIARV